MTTLRDIAENILLEGPSSSLLVESFPILARAGTRKRIPPHLLKKPGVARWIASNPHFSAGMWSHQVVALEHLHTGENVLQTTSTGSGKTVVPVAHALYKLGQNPNAKILAVYPTKALQMDQRRSWQQAMTAAGHSPDDVGVIHGDVMDRDERLAIVARSKVLICNPDIIHSWMLPNLGEKPVSDFIRQMNMVFIDEAQLYNHVLGSQGMYLFRRLEMARDGLRKMAPHHYGDSRLNYIAASASLYNGAGFLEKLTGQKFKEIGQDQDGSAKSDQDILHLGSEPGKELSTARDLILQIMQSENFSMARGAGICFVDSRKGVERLAEEINEAMGSLIAQPWRSGYSTDDREGIDYQIRNGDCRLIIATSALEQGVEFPDMQFGICVGVPNTPGALPQRIGRVGRTESGLFVVIAPPGEFKSRGHTLQDICTRRIARPVTFEGNQGIQLANALCLDAEMKLAGLPADAAIRQDRLNWPRGFEKTVHHARTGTLLVPPDLADKIRRHKKTPWSIHGLRSLSSGSTSFELVCSGDNGEKRVMGRTSLEEALRECYPGAFYRHKLVKYKVDGWEKPARGRKTGKIILRSTKLKGETFPLTQTFVNIDPFNCDPTSKDLAGRRGSVTLLPFFITKKLLGYSLQKRECRMRRFIIRQQTPHLPETLRQQATVTVCAISQAVFCSNLTTAN